MLGDFNSKRYRLVKIRGRSYILPRSIADNSKIFAEFVRYVELSYKAYEKLISKGIPEEDARYILIEPVDPESKDF